MKCLVVALSLIALTFGRVGSPNTSAPAQAAIDPRQVIQRSAEACRKVRSIEYLEEQSVGDGEEKSPALTANVRQARADIPQASFVPGKVVAEGTSHRGGQDSRQFAYSYDGATLRVLDASEKIVRVVKSPTPRVAGSLLAAQELGGIGLPQFTQDQPFKSILETAVGFDYAGTRIVKGVVCHVVLVTQTINHPATGAQTIKATWFIGRDDSLPRGNEIGAFRKTVQILKVNSPDAAAEFFVSTPAGYGEKLVTGNESKTKGLLEIGAEAPDWTLTDPQGRAHSLKDYRGKVVLLDFWGTWCVPCWKTMPAVQSLHEKFKDRGVVVIGVAVADEEGHPVEYMKLHRYSYNLLLKGDEVATLYRAAILPTLYVIGADGRVAHAEFGFRENAKPDLTAIIERQLKSPGK
jgi:peroxiredoxin